MTFTYYKMKFRLVSPLSVGSGEDEHTDCDVALDSSGNPFIPATAFAGVIRHLCGAAPHSEVFGYIDGEKSAQSKIRFYDAFSVSKTFVTLRDMVALENKVGKKGAKFDQEAVEAQTDFVTLFELHNMTDAEQLQFIQALAAFDKGYLRLGSKTSRGYGQIKVIELKKACFVLPDDRAQWLDFEPYDWDSDTNYTNCQNELREMEHTFLHFRLELKQNGAISIRSYTARNGKEIGDADFEQLSTSKGIPVIPGTSWAGAFRERFRYFANDEQFTNEVFGFVNTDNNTQQKSKIYFSESSISDSTRKIITRNSIDRFSAATKDGALYTENTVYNGNCELDLFLDKSISDLEKAKKILFAVIRDLHRGYLAVGGLTAVGRGLFNVTSMTVDGEDCTAAITEGGVSA